METPPDSVADWADADAAEAAASTLLESVWGAEPAVVLDWKGKVREEDKVSMTVSKRRPDVYALMRTGLTHVPVAAVVAAAVVVVFMVVVWAAVVAAAVDWSMSNMGD